MINESELEETALDWFLNLGYQTVFGPDISPDGTDCERSNYEQVILVGRLRTAYPRYRKIY